LKPKRPLLKAGRAAAWIEELPPFWLAFLSLSLFTLPVSTLALPIATAEVPPALTLVGLLLVCGLNLLTLTCVAEASTRTLSVREGTAFYGQMVSHYLGPPGALLLSLPLLLQCVLVLLGNTIGLSNTLQDLTGIAAPAWVFVLGPMILIRLWRESRTFGVASVLLIGGTNASLLLLLALMALGHLRPAAFSQGQPRDVGDLAGMLAAFAGVVFALYNSHAYVCQSAKRTLKVDPSGRSLVNGSLCGVLCSTVLFSLWIQAVRGAVPPEQLSGERGTVLGPLAGVLGSTAIVGGMVLAWLLPGQGSLRVSGLFFNLLHERVPGRFWLSAAPVIAVLAAAEWLLLTGQGSFTRIVNFYGVLVFPTTGGIIPLMLLAASRRRGDAPAPASWPWLGNVFLLGALYVFYVGTVLLHGLVIWKGKPLQEFSALATAALMAGATAAAIRRGSFRGQAA